MNDVRGVAEQVEDVSASYQLTWGISVIHKCALAVIAKQGQGVTGPFISPTDAQEESFLSRHVDKLRQTVNSHQTRGHFQTGSFLEADVQRLLVANDADFLEIADRHASALAAAMERTSNAKACVMALLTMGPRSGADQVSLLKLDAEVEAAQFEQTAGGLRLRVMQELLPRPGDIQKGFSWPDPRSPRSTIIVLDKLQAGGGTAKYFKAAFELDVSPKAADTESALIDAIAELPLDSVEMALTAAGVGGDAEKVVDRIRQVIPDFAPTAVELGAGGALGGSIRPSFSSQASKTFLADGFELKVPLASLGQVETRREGGRYVTSIITEFPLTPPVNELSVDPPF